MLPNNSNNLENPVTSCNVPTSVLELDLLFRQRMQELRAEGTAELNALHRRRESKARNYLRKAELRKQIEDLRYELRQLVAEDMAAERESEAIYHQFCQEQAQRKAALQEWFTHERIRLANKN